MRIAVVSWSTAALLFSAVALTACSPVKQACTTASNCGDLPTGESESQCETNGNDCITDLNKGATQCQKVATDLNALFSCTSGLSCTDLKADDENGKCDSENDQLTADLTTAASANCELSACVSE